MKTSRYNYILYTDTHGYWYNALTGSFFRLSSSLSKKIESLSEDLTFLEKNVKTMYDKMKDNGFIIPADVNEIDLVRQKHDEAVHRKDYFMVVLPTLNSNYSCWYCIQDHIPTVMSDTTLEALKRHIDYMIDVKEIESLHLDWFGGEPFMFFKKVIEPLSRYAINRCEEKGVPFMNGSTTNGYFLTPEVASLLTELKFKRFQITLDGEKKFHDKVKFTKGCESTFEHVLKNINNILSLNPDIRVFLRINYTHKTLTPQMVDEVNEFIEYNNRECITVTPKKVWQENTDKNFTSTIQQIIDLFDASGYKVSRWDIPSGSIPCYVSKEYYNAINFNGNVVKCTACNDLYERQAKGVLKDNGIIEWNDSYDIKCQSRTFENERCLDCKKLPVCVGICPRDHILGKTHCKYDVIDSDFEKDLINYLVHQYY